MPKCENGLESDIHFEVKLFEDIKIYWNWKPDAKCFMNPWPKRWERLMKNLVTYRTLRAFWGTCLARMALPGLKNKRKEKENNKITTKLC